MAWALLFLPLLLALAGSALPIIRPELEAEDQAAVRALLLELVMPQALPPQGVSCQALHPEALPGFTRLPPLPRALVRAAMALALSGVACAPQAEAEVLALARELSPTKAAALLRGLARLQGAPAPQALSLLLSLAQLGSSAPPWHCAVPTRLSDAHPTAPSVPSATGLRLLLGTRTQAWLPKCRRIARRRREDENVCNPPGEEKAHGVLAWVPGVSTFYNLGTSIYYAFQGCEALASTRALEAAEDLGYAGLAAIVAAAGGPVALGVQLGLQPGLKAGVRALISYFTSDGDPVPAPTVHSGPVLII